MCTGSDRRRIRDIDIAASSLAAIDQRLKHHARPFFFQLKTRRQRQATAIRRYLPKKTDMPTMKISKINVIGIINVKSCVKLRNANLDQRSHTYQSQNLGERLRCPVSSDMQLHVLHFDI